MRVAASLCSGVTRTRLLCSFEQVEDAKRLLVLSGNKTNQVMKDVLTDVYKLRKVRVCASFPYMRVPFRTQGCTMPVSRRD
jgi:hypothetical protein